MSHPPSYKAYAFTEKDGQLQKITVPWKDPQVNEVVVKVLSCGVCGGDETVKHQVFPTGLPRVPGHEIVGDVVAIHPTEKILKVGERVGAGWHGGNCFTCNACRSGSFLQCEKHIFNGVTRDGGYAEYVILRTEAAIRIPTDMDPALAAPLVCAGVTTFNALRNVNIRLGSLIVVQGVGGLGHLAIQYANKMGYRTIAVSSSSAKREVALQLGASEYLDSSKDDLPAELQKRGGASAILFCGGPVEIGQKLMAGLASGGQFVILGPCDMKIPSTLMIGKSLSIKGWPSGTPKDSEECVEYSERQGILPTVQTFTLDQAQEAYDHRSSARFRAVIVPGKNSLN